MIKVTPQSTQEEIVKFARLKAHPVYCVQEGMEGGYMPSSVSYFATKTDARAYMVDRARSARSDGYIVHGSAKDGQYTLHQPGRSSHSLCEIITMGESSVGELHPDIDRIIPLSDVIDQLNCWSA